MAQTKKFNRKFRIMESIPTGGSRPALCVAYVLLSGTSAYALNEAIQSSSSSPYALGTFGFLLGHGLLGFVHSTLADPPAIVKTIVQHTTWLSQVLPLALLNAEFFTLTGFPSLYAYAHLASPLPPAATLFAMEENHQQAIDTVVLLNIASLGYLQYEKQTGAWTGGILALTALNNFAFPELAHHTELPRVEILTIGLSFLVVFAMQALKEVK